MKTLITGASSGIGAALAEECARRGEALFLCGRNEERLAAVVARCCAAACSAGHDAAQVLSEVVDVADEAAVRDWIARCSAQGPLDRVFANAGVSTGEETEANVRRTFAVNVGGVVNTTLAALECGARQIVITASIAGYGPLKACPSYSATKACVKTWGLALRGALAVQGTKVNVVCPGFVRSRITDGNTCPMPFFLEADVAARKILRGVDRNVGLIAFPWPMRFATWLLSILPVWLNEQINHLLPKKVI